MSAATKSPTDAELRTALGSATELWSRIVHIAEAAASPLDTEWRPSKAAFGRMCLLRHKKRTLLYLTPERGRVTVAMVLGERACGIAIAGSLPAAIKTMISEARPYAEGRGIRISVSSASDLPSIKQLVEIKLAPKLV